MDEQLMITSPQMQEALNEEIAKVSTIDPEFSSAPPQYTEEEKEEFLKAMQEYGKKHPYMAPGQKKYRSRMTNLIPKKKKRK